VISSNDGERHLKQLPVNQVIGHEVSDPQEQPFQPTFAWQFFSLQQAVIDDLVVRKPQSTLTWELINQIAAFPFCAALQLDLERRYPFKKPVIRTPKSKNSGIRQSQA
jgi:hypothetical protein